MGRYHLKFYSGEYVKIAIELGYPDKYIEKIKNSKSENEALKWLTTARKELSETECSYDKKEQT